MIAALLTLVLFVAAGWAFAPARDVLCRLGMAYLVGAGIAFGVLFAESLVHLRWSVASLVVPLVLIAVLGAIARRATLAARWPRLHGIDLLTLLLVAGYVRFAVIAPTVEYDHISIWGLKAKEFFLAGGIDWGWLSNPFNEFAHVDYPLLAPLVFDVQTLLAGAWPERWLGMINVGFGVAALFVLRSFLDEELSSRWLVATATLALAWTALSPWLGLGEVMMVAYGLAGLLLVRRGETLAGALFLGLAASSKNEGLTLIVAAAVGLLIAGRVKEIVRLWPSVAIAGPWLVLRSAHHLQTDLTTGGMLSRVLQHVSNAGAIVQAMDAYSLGKPLFWGAVLAAFLLGIRRVGGERFLASAIGVQLLFFIAAYFITPHDVTWHVRWSWARIVIQLAGLIGFLAVIAISPFLEEKSAPA